MNEQTSTNADQDIKDNSNLLNNGAVDSDLKSESNLLNESTNTQDLVDKAQIVTEVTSVAKENERSGNKINVPSPEELVARATASYHRNITMLSSLIKARNGGSYQISRKGMSRVLSAILQMPTDGLPVGLQGDEEKLAFTLGQKVLMDRYILTHYHIVEEQKRVNEERKAKAAAEEAAKATETAEVKSENVTEEVKSET